MYLMGEGVIGDMARKGVDAEQPPHIDDLVGRYPLQISTDEL